MHDIEKFIAGFRQFQENYFRGDHQLFDRLREGQKPRAMVIGCSDSRVDPALLLGCEPGDIFMVRNVGNLVPPYEPDATLHGVSAALEYGVKHLKVDRVIIFGHSQCGAIDALLQETTDDSGEFIGRWVNIAKAARDKVREELAWTSADVRQRACELASILVSLENLMTFPWIRSRAEAGELHLHAWYFDLAKGELLDYMPETGSFEPLVPRCP